jgi:hypothetical protein
MTLEQEFDAQYEEKKQSKKEKKKLSLIKSSFNVKKMI